MLGTPCHRHCFARDFQNLQRTGGANMNNQNSYQKQKNLSFAQFLTEIPSFILVLISFVLSRTLLIFVDLLDSLTYMIRNIMVMVLSKKLSKDLQFEYNYGVEKIEAISSLLCDSILLFGVFLTLCLSVYSIFFPTRPSDLLIAVVGLKLFDVILDLTFFIKQRKILKSHRSAIYETNCAAAFGALLFDGFALISLFVMWLLRNNPIGGYISPAISIFVSLYLTVGCVKRIKTALVELTDKTLPEKTQMKILSILNRFYNGYSQFHSVKSHKSGDFITIDLHLSFEKNTSFDEIVHLKKQMQDEFDKQIGRCIVNIIVKNN